MSGKTILIVIRLIRCKKLTLVCILCQANDKMNVMKIYVIKINSKSAGVDVFDNAMTIIGSNYWNFALQLSKSISGAAV